MAELLFWQTSGYVNSLNTALAIAIQLRGQGMDVAVLFDEAAIRALAEGKFDPSPELADRFAAIAENVQRAGWPVNPMEYVNQAQSAGVKLYGCGGWCDFLGVRDKVPPQIQILEIPDVVQLVGEAKRIAGGA